VSEDKWVGRDTEGSDEKCIQNFNGNVKKKFI
jgi:hypothetical protein